MLVLKQGAEIDRKESEKGEKDRLDILSLVLFCEVNFKEYFSVLKKIKKENFYFRLIEIIKNFKDYEYLNLNPREFKLKKEEILKKLKKI